MCIINDWYVIRLSDSWLRDSKYVVLKLSHFKAKCSFKNAFNNKQVLLQIRKQIVYQHLKA